MNQTIKIQALTLALVLVSGCQKNEISEQNTAQQPTTSSQKEQVLVKMLKKQSKSTNKNLLTLLVIMAKKLPLMRLI